jgi:hypothetical protein
MSNNPYLLHGDELARTEAARKTGATTTPKPRAGEHTGSRTPLVDAIVKKFPHSGQLEELARNLEAERDLLRERERELVEALEELTLRCDGQEGLRADGSNIQTMRAHAILAKHGR